MRSRGPGLLARHPDVERGSTPSSTPCSTGGARRRRTLPRLPTRGRSSRSRCAAIRPRGRRPPSARGLRRRRAPRPDGRIVLMSQWSCIATRGSGRSRSASSPSDGARSRGPPELRLLPVRRRRARVHRRRVRVDRGDDRARHPRPALAHGARIRSTQSSRYRSSPCEPGTACGRRRAARGLSLGDWGWVLGSRFSVLRSGFAVLGSGLSDSRLPTPDSR